MNVLAIVDEEAKFPNGTDDSCLGKLHDNHGKAKGIYIQPKGGHIKKFGIVHYAGEVMYDIPGFLDKNRNTFSADLLRCFGEGDNDYFKDLYKEDLAATAETKKKVKTLGFQFKASLDALMKTLRVCHPWFVRCVKPNHNKCPGEFDRLLCTRQLRYSGMMETIRIRKAGYPIRHTFQEAINRYRLLDTSCAAATGGAKDKDVSIALFTKLLGESDPGDKGWQVSIP